jgi:hypothetical protein
MLNVIHASGWAGCGAGTRAAAAAVELATSEAQTSAESNLRGCRMNCLPQK